MHPMRTKHSGNRKARTKTKEMAVHQGLQKAGLDFEYQKHIPFAKCGLQSETQYAFLDFVFTTPWGYIVLEVDEDQHKSYPASCDVRRDFDIVASVSLGSAQKLVILHFNPDAFRIAGQTCRTPSKERLAKLVTVIQDMPEPKGFERLFMYYDRETSDDTLPSIASDWNDVVARQVSRCL